MKKFVGWVERSEAHHRCGETMGFATLNPSYGVLSCRRTAVHKNHKKARHSGAPPPGPRSARPEDRLSGEPGTINTGLWKMDSGRAAFGRAP